MPNPRMTFSLLRIPTFRMMWLGSIISHLGIWIHMVAAAWMMTSLTESKTLVAMVQSSLALPVMCLALISGVMADSFERRYIMIAAQIFGLVTSLALIALTLSGLISAWSLLILSMLVGAGLAFNLPAWQTSIIQFVGKENLSSAVSLNSIGVNLTRSVGPAIGGIIVAMASAIFAFALNALCYIPLLVTLVFWKPPAAKKTLPREPFGRAIAAGVRYVTMAPNLQRVMLRGFIFGLSAIAMQALLPLVVRQELNASALWYGLLFGCFGGGAVAGALAVVRLRDLYPGEFLVRGAFCLLAIGTLLIVLPANIYAAGLGAIFGGVGWVTALNIFNVTVQLSSPRWVVGRTYALYQTCNFGGMAVGSWLWGTIADAFSTNTALLCAVPFLCFGAVVGLRFPVPEYGRLNLDPLDEFREPRLHLELDHSSGPVLITIEYEIDTSDVEVFLEVMADRRRMRIRDGAQNWTLLRDLEAPNHWSEQYHVPTWLDYLRHNQRRTKADAEIQGRLRALHRGQGSPTVRRQIERSTIPLRHKLPRVIE